MINKELIENINKIIKEKGSCILAIDGRCGSGKSTLASQLAKYFDGDVIHMDDFFLQPHQRNEERYKTPGENVDHERMMEEVFSRLEKKEEFTYYPFDCVNMEISKEGIEIHNKELIVVEGSYSLREEFRKYYDLTVFLTIPYDIQIERIKERNPDKINRFINEWIPLEEDYFEYYRVEDYANIKINNE